MDNIVYEIITYGNCVNINDFMLTIDKIQTLIQNEKVIDYLNNVKTNYTQYINKLLTKYNKQYKYTPPINIFDIFEETDMLLSFGIIVNDVLLYNDKILSAYSLLKSIENNFEEDNMKIYTNNIDDYVACYICLLNIVYNHGGGKNIDDIIINDYNDVYFQNVIYLSATIDDINIETQNMFTFIPTTIANNQNKQSVEYKQLLLNKFIPIRFVQRDYDINYFGVLMKKTNLFTRLFSLDDVPNVVYTAKSDWTKQTQTVMIHENTNLLNKLYLYEENIRHVKQIIDIKQNYNQQRYHENINKYFTNLDIKYDFLQNVSYVEVKLGDIIKMIRSISSRLNNEGTLYPYISSIDTNNGIYTFVDHMDTQASEDNPIISIGMTHSGKGFAFVHTYNFAHSPNVVLFKLTNKNYNIYNVAFSITEYLTHLSSSLPRYISAKYILSQNVKIIVSKIE